MRFIRKKSAPEPMRFFHCRMFLGSDRTGETGFPVGRYTAETFPFQSVGVNHDRGKVVAVADPQIINAVAVITLKVG